MEHNQLYSILKKHQIIEYFIYVEDILTMYNENKTSIDETLTELTKRTKSI
jgi:hypothetical protein